MIQPYEQEALPAAQHAVSPTHGQSDRGSQQRMLVVTIAVGAFVEPAHVHGANVYLVVTIHLSMDAKRRR